jgi:LPXTG-site transpeptidase (sortase) family protein
MLQTGTPAAKKGITVSRNKSVDTARPTWFAPTTLAKVSTDVSSWTRLLPKGDRNQNMYVVIPTVGMIAPIQSPSDAAIVAKFNAGTITTKEVSKYFLAGALHHPNSATPGMNGNMILGGHSSWFSRDKSAYRTVFQGIIEADAGEQVWVFMKNVDGGYNLYKYNIYASYNTTPGDMDALMQTEGAEITLYTCTPIGGVKGRWVVKAKLISE